MSWMYGLELESTMRGIGGDILIPYSINRMIPVDNCLYLVEARGKPADNPLEAVYMLMAEERRIKGMLGSTYSLDHTPIITLSKENRRTLRKFRIDKSEDKSNNLYGYKEHNNDETEHTVGLHVSVTKPQKITVGDKSHTYNAVWDYADFVRYMDDYFSKEIKASKRNPGFYEIKPDGRIEYRSLPSNVDLEKVILALSKYSFK